MTTAQASHWRESWKRFLVNRSVVAINNADFSNNVVCLSCLGSGGEIGLEPFDGIAMKMWGECGHLLASRLLYGRPKADNRLDLYCTPKNLHRDVM